jgi:hypothetical protein
MTANRFRWSPAASVTTLFPRYSDSPAASRASLFVPKTRCRVIFPSRTVMTQEHGESVSISLALPRIEQCPKTTTSSPFVVIWPATGRTSSQTSSASAKYWRTP